jgi:Zn-dependent protease with chaperone function
MKYTQKTPEGNVNISHTHPLKEMCLLCGGVVGIVLLVYLFLGVAIDLFAPYVPREIEDSIASKFPEFSDAEAPQRGYLQQLTDRLAQAAPYDAGAVTVGVIEMPEENAFALPGGRIYVSQGLLENVGSENELAMVLAHEIGHCANRDHLRSLGRGVAMALIASLVIGNDEAVERFVGASLTLGHLNYSRKQEKAADLYALETLTTHYGHGGGATAFFQRIKDTDARKLAPEFLSTHPDPEQRLSYLNSGLDERDGGEAALTPLPKEWGAWLEDTVTSEP